MTGDETRPRVNAVYRFADPDYKFGLGTLLCRVTRVVEKVRFDNEPWWHIDAFCKRAVTDAGAERRLYVRASAVVKSRVQR
ncbi:hypothetical protein ACIA8K_36745 [Catenuloplanes sp. NPDC051500]|uniref:hypothetical protein n=1 Tax=Catenuloplanes sp. NPDC051500 TaxID=3363959 RepID=UPI0037AA06DE